MLLCPRSLWETAITAVPKVLPSVREWIYSYIHIQPVCSFCLVKKQVEFACPAEWLMEKQAYVFSTHLGGGGGGNNAVSCIQSCLHC